MDNLSADERTDNAAAHWHKQVLHRRGVQWSPDHANGPSQEIKCYVGHPAGKRKEAKSMTGSVLTTKSLRLKIEHLDTWRTVVTLHSVPMDLMEERLGVFFSRFGQVGDVLAASSKTGIVIGHSCK